MDVVEFLQSPLARHTRWRKEEHTAAIRIACELCGAESTVTATGESVVFRHAPLCVASLAAGTRERARWANEDDRDGDVTETEEESKDQVLYIKRELWMLLMEEYETLIEIAADRAEFVLALLRRIAATSEPLQPALVSALEDHLAEAVAARDHELEGVRQLAKTPSPVASPDGPGRAAPDGSAPVIGSKALWDSIAGLMSATLDSHAGFARMHLELIADLQSGRTPDPQVLAELRQMDEERLRDIAEDREAMDKLFGSLQWVPNQV
jgi:hypothetical protein